MKMKIICKTCGKECVDLRSLGVHITRTHKDTVKNYYDEFMKKDNEGICKICKNKTNFIGITKGYYIYCSSKCANRDEETKNKILKTSTELYGGIGFASKELREKSKTSAIKNGHNLYGNIQKMKQTLKKKFGYEYPAQITEFKEKIKNTKDINNSPTSYKFKYKNTFFDSSWELAYYIWLEDHNINFEYHKQNFYYEYEFSGVNHRYYPDFIVDNKVIDLKNKYLYSRLLIENTQENAKYKCMIENNVCILLEQDMEPYLNYIQNNYGKFYLMEFKCEQK